MLIKKPSDIKSNEITDKKVYMNRRLFMRGAALAGSAVATAWLYRELNVPPPPPRPSVKIENIVKAEPSFEVPAVNEALTPLDSITTYNNFYEFDTNKGGVASAAADFVARPWSVSVEGLVGKPKVFDLDEILKLAPQEERIYRFRCVEGWSMVIPWDGFQLSKLLEKVEPLPSAKYVAFQTLYDPKRMPNQRSGILDWPYVEGLRMDEAMHPLTILATGIYGEELPPQDGAPVRLVVPWKYGFKSIKSIVKIKLVESEPPTTWNIAAPDEY